MDRNKPYRERDGIEKILTQWNKLSGLHERNEPSAAIVRAATAAELAANFAIREEFASRSKFSSACVDRMLRNAKGLGGKLDNLLVPLSMGEKHYESIRALKNAASGINAKRNDIVHSGDLANAEEAAALIQQSRAFIETLVRLYKPDFELKRDCATHERAAV